MPKDTKTMGDWGDFIEREEAREKNARDSEKYNKDKNRNNKGMRPPSSGGPRADASRGRKEKGSDNDLGDFFNSEFAGANFRLDNKDQQFRHTYSGADTKDTGRASLDADDIRDKAKKDIDDIAQEQKPWNIKAEDIAPEHLATLYNTGTVYKILGIFFSKQMYRSRVKQAQKDIDAMHKSRNKEHKLQEKHSAHLTKEEHKKQIMEQQVRDSEAQLTLERERILRPVELEYERLREKVSGLNQAQYSMYRDPINKIGNTFQKFWTEKQSLPRIERKIKRRKDKIHPLEIDHQNLTADLNGLAANVKHLHQEIQGSKNRIAAIENQIYSIAGIDPFASNKESGA